MNELSAGRYISYYAYNKTGADDLRLILCDKIQTTGYRD